MKHIIVSIVAAALVSLICNLGLEVKERSADSNSFMLKDEELAASIRENIKAITLLRSELTGIRKMISRSYELAGLGDSKTGSVKENELMERLKAVEDSIERLSEAGSVPATKQVGAIKGLLSENAQSLVELADRYQSEYENDSGIPLNDFSGSINETLHSLNGIDVSGVECGETVCKVVYTSIESTGLDERPDSEYALEDILAQSAEGREVEVRYAKNPYGGKVMYIQFR